MEEYCSFCRPYKDIFYIITNQRILICFVGENQKWMKKWEIFYSSNIIFFIQKLLFFLDIAFIFQCNKLSSVIIIEGNYEEFKKLYCKILEEECFLYNIDIIFQQSNFLIFLKKYLFIFI